MKDRTNRISDLFSDDDSDSLPVVLSHECDDDAWQCGFQGGVYDDAAALYDFAPRHYSPRFAQWVVTDPDPVGYVEGADLSRC